MASMLRNNPQLFNLHVGYEDGSFLEMDVIDRAMGVFDPSCHPDKIHLSSSARAMAWCG